MERVEVESCSNKVEEENAQEEVVTYSGEEGVSHAQEVEETSCDDGVEDGLYPLVVVGTRSGMAFHNQQPHYRL